MNPYEFSATLPRIGQFNRPIWAYDRLDNGWQVLRRHLFGATDRLLIQLDELGNQPIPDKYFEKSRFQLNEGLLPILEQIAPQHTGTSLAQWYAKWEDDVFEIYCTAAWDEFYRHGGGK